MSNTANISQTERLNHIFHKSGIYDFLHLLILALSIFLVICISIDSYKNEAFYKESQFMQVQLWICVIFLADFFIEFFLSPDKKHYLATRFIFFLVSIPYNAIISHYGWEFSPMLTYCIRYIPLIRGGYAMSIVVSWFTYNRATGLFISYLMTLLFTIYFSSLAFFLFEKGVNPGVKTYGDAVWWAFMDATTVGSNIVAVTTVGKVLSVLLAAIGMMMFPIFTVYVTNILTKHNQQGQNPLLSSDPAQPAPAATAPSAAPASQPTASANSSTAQPTSAASASNRTTD